MSGRVIFEGIDHYGTPSVEVKEWTGYVQFDWNADEWLVVEEKDGSVRLFSRDRVITAVIDPPSDSQGNAAVVDIGNMLDADGRELRSLP